MSLTDDDRQLLEKAREIGPSLRASSGDRDRLAGWLLAELVALAEKLAEQLAGQLAGPAEAKAPPDSMCEDCPHGRTAHLTRAPSRTEPYFCSACECRQYRGPHYATIPPLGERSAKAIEAGHEAIKDIDRLIAQLFQVRAQLVSELRQDEDIRAVRVDAWLAERQAATEIEGAL